MLIDCHCHAGTGEALTAPWNTSAPIEFHLDRARAAGIDRTVVFPINSLDYERANAELAEIAARHPEELIGFARVHPVADSGRIHRLVERAAREFGFRGLKVHGGDALPTREVCEAARAFGLPVLVDITDRSNAVEMFAGAYQDVNFIIAHLGSFAGNWLVHLQTIDQMVRYPNVYADTSGVRFFDYLVEAVRRAGAKKLLFGSDGPLLHPGVELQRVKHLPLSPADEARVLGENLLELLPGGEG